MKTRKEKKRDERGSGPTCRSLEPLFFQKRKTLTKERNSWRDKVTRDEETKEKEGESRGTSLVATEKERPVTEKGTRPQGLKRKVQTTVIQSFLETRERATLERPAKKKAVLNTGKVLEDLETARP